MALPIAMPEKIAIRQLLRQLLADAFAWSQTEMELTRQDARAAMRRYVVALGFLFVAFAILIAAVFTLAQTVIGALASYVYGHIFAGLIVSFTLIVIAILLLAAARYFLTSRPKSKGLIFRRFKGSHSDEV